MKITTQTKSAIKKWNPVFKKLYQVDELVKTIYQKNTALLLNEIVFTTKVTSILSNDKYKCFLSFNSLFSFIELKDNANSLRGFLINDSSGFEFHQFEKAVDKLNDFFIEKGLGDFTKSTEWNNRMIECTRYKSHHKCISSQGKYLKEIREKLNSFKVEITNDPTLIWNLKIRSTMGVLRCEDKVPFAPLNKSLLKDKSFSGMKLIEHPIAKEKEKLEKEFTETLRNALEIKEDNPNIKVQQLTLFLKHILKMLNEEDQYEQVASNIDLNIVGGLGKKSFENFEYDSPSQNSWEEPLIKELLSKILERMIKLGFGPDYISPSIEISIWNELKKIPFEGLKDLVRPNDYKQPYVQIVQAATQSKTFTKNERGDESYFKKAVAIFLEFLASQKIGVKEKLKYIFNDEYLGIRFKEWIKINYLETKRIKVNTARKYISAFNSILTLVKGIDPLFLAETRKIDQNFEGSVDKELYAMPFSDTERFQLEEAIDQEVKWAKRFTEAYIPLTLAEKEQVEKNLFHANGFNSRAESTINSVKWYYEKKFPLKSTNKVLDGDDLLNFSGTKTNNKNKYFQGFEAKALKSYFNKDNSNTTNRYYQAFDVLHVSTNWNLESQLLPFILKILEVTGLNITPLYDLTVNSLERKDHISKQPVLRYWKNRSSGGKRLHLPLLNSNFTELNSSAFYELQDCFDNILRITKFYRELANEKDRNILILIPIFESGSKAKVIGAQTLKDKRAKTFKKTINKFAQKYELKTDSGEVLNVVLRRFRPTLVSKMLKNGDSIIKISHALGHKNISTTYLYLEEHDLMGFINEKIERVLKNIHKKSFKPEVERPTVSEIPIQTKMPMATCDCRNPLEPPDSIMKSSDLIQGQICTQYNKCLFCSHAVISTHHLPTIFMIQIKHERNLDEIEGSPLEKTVREELKFLKDHVTGKGSPFNRQQLKEAKELAEINLDMETSDCTSLFGR